MIITTAETRKATWRNSPLAYGRIARALHWGMALAVFGLFALGIWMRSLSYYHPWYQTAPDLHRAVGMVLLALLVLRLIWRVANPQPRPLGTGREHRIAAIVHWLFYVLLLALMVAGYLISTADGRPIDVFGIVSIPALWPSKGIERFAGPAHEYLAYALMALAALHAAAALKHHLIDRDATLVRMVFGTTGPGAARR